MRQNKRPSRDSRPAAANGSALPRRSLLGRAVDAALKAVNQPTDGRHRRGLCEALEDRRLLTTLLGGESLQFSSIDFGDIDPMTGMYTSIPVVVQVTGSDAAQVELFGASFGIEGNQVGDISGFLQSPDPDRNGSIRGGIGGRIGSQPLVPDDQLFISEAGGTQAFNADRLHWLG